jgi:hypothetical protein
VRKTRNCRFFSRSRICRRFAVHSATLSHNSFPEEPKLFPTSPATVASEAFFPAKARRFLNLKLTTYCFHNNVVFTERTTLCILHTSLTSPYYLCLLRYPLSAGNASLHSKCQITSISDHDHLQEETESQCSMMSHFTSLMS